MEKVAMAKAILDLGQLVLLVDTLLYLVNRATMVAQAMATVMAGGHAIAPTHNPTVNPDLLSPQQVLSQLCQRASRALWVSSTHLQRLLSLPAPSMLRARCRVANHPTSMPA
eukprot:11878313-Karenia_brevis.AAC.1